MSIKDLPAGCSKDTMLSSAPDEGGENRLLGPTNPVLTTLPSNFNAQIKFASCADVIGHIRDQAECHNCWASASVGMFNDRVCIQSGGRITDILSLAYLTSCCNHANGCPKSDGCRRGSVAEGLIFMKNHGIVTGGEYKPPKKLGNDDGCWPYPFPKCNHVPGMKVKYPRCGSKVGRLAAPSHCDGLHCRRAGDVHRAKSWGRLPISPEKIKQEIFDNGPVAAIMTIHEDFRLYKSGVYEYKTGAMVGAHTLKLIGWGVEAGQEYWLAVNSWNEEWGDQGKIKLAVGKNALDEESRQQVPRRAVNELDEDAMMAESGAKTQKAMAQLKEDVFVEKQVHSHFEE
ncbi:cathepsin B, putative [Perkinsus marinus ATCC 50983]|uniref:Cathepsin B, putative n=1 Tax=Perkinsus marinus (strain ATCC 50983 / TXsc) TaxID=423536 RepID=C5LEL9_PERM5|nr:cathepsin B, putative [Perkinsus marinus ATCC 50983]EER04837.1 cathepsin B, putative [Perkinsus marinus ATCC 50983]|eukprot:XP_002773021.1 cathepsin B, putative [Perkinsus marinus ATCC 50983]